MEMIMKAINHKKYLGKVNFEMKFARFIHIVELPRDVSYFVYIAHVNLNHSILY